MHFDNFLKLIHNNKYQPIDEFIWVFFSYHQQMHFKLQYYCAKFYSQYPNCRQCQPTIKPYNKPKKPSWNLVGLPTKPRHLGVNFTWTRSTNWGWMPTSWLTISRVTLTTPRISWRVSTELLKLTNRSERQSSKVIKSLVWPCGNVKNSCY